VGDEAGVHGLRVAGCLEVGVDEEVGEERLQEVAGGKEDVVVFGRGEELVDDPHVSVERAVFGGL